MTQGTVRARRELSPHVIELEIETEKPITYQSGQWVSLALPTGPTPPLKRAYSMVHPQRKDECITLLIDRVEDGLGSNYLFASQVGDTLQIHDCMGTFTLPDSLPSAVCLCFHFTGVAPARALAESMVERNYDCPILVVASMPPGEPFFYEEYFAEPRFEVLRCTTNPMVSAWMESEDGARASNRIIEFLDAHPEALFLASGVGPFVRPLRSLAKSMGFDRKRIRIQRYC